MPTSLPVLTSATRLLSGSASSSPMSPHDQPPPPQPPTVPLGRPPQHPHLEQPFVICGLHGAAVATCWPARSPPGAIAACSSWPLPLPSGVRFWLGLGPAQRPLCHPPCSLQRPCFLSPRVRAVRAWPTLSSSRRRLSKHSPEAAPPGLSWGGAGQVVCASTAHSVCPGLYATTVHRGARPSLSGLCSLLPTPTRLSPRSLPAPSSWNSMNHPVPLTHTHTLPTRHTAFQPPRPVQLGPAVRPPKSWRRGQAMC